MAMRDVSEKSEWREAKVEPFDIKYYPRNEKLRKVRKRKLRARAEMKFSLVSCSVVVVTVSPSLRRRSLGARDDFERTQQTN